MVSGWDLVGWMDGSPGGVKYRAPLVLINVKTVVRNTYYYVGYVLLSLILLPENFSDTLNWKLKKENVERTNIFCGRSSIHIAKRSLSIVMILTFFS